MKLIIAGTRHVISSVNHNSTDDELQSFGNAKQTVFKIISLIHSKFPITEVVHGAAKGVDTLAKLWAIENNIPHTGNRFKADWKYGKGAGPARNEKMAQYGEGLLAFPLVPHVKFGVSKGTQDMITRASNHNLGIIKAPIEIVESEGVFWYTVKGYKVITKS